MKVDFLIDTGFGDNGKGKISKVLNEKYKYKSVIKFNGSGNAGHAVWIDDSKYVSHYLTSGIYSNDTNIIIGPGCVLNVDEFLKEYNQFNDKFKLDGRVFIHPYTHIIQDKHIDIDKLETKIGTTNKGNGPCYSDKYNRTGIRAENINKLESFILPKEYIKDIFNVGKIRTVGDNRVLMEGSQGWGLDIDHGNYPYVTSSHIHPGFAFATFGIPLDKIGDVYGVCKIYETYVGESNDIMVCDPTDEEIIRNIGKEFGETTGRPRKIGYLDMNRLVNSINQVGISTLFINKIDVLNELNIFKVIIDDKIIEYDTIYEMQNNINSYLESHTQINRENIYYSGNKDGSDIIIRKKYL